MVNLENFMLRIQIQKATYCIIPLYEMSRVGKSIETENRLVAARDKDGEGSQKRKCLIVGAGFLFGMLKSLNIILR